MPFSVIFGIMFAIVFVFIFVFTMLSIVSPKFRGRMMSKNMKSLKHLMDETKEDFESLSKNISESKSKSVTCQYCGAKINKDADTCSHCGAKNNN